MEEDGDETEEEYLARTLREFGLDPRGMALDLPDDDSVPGWTDDDLEQW